MSSIGTGYDLAASTFSPDGRIFQVEYAQKAVDNSGTMIALRGKDGVVCAVDKVISSKLNLENANSRLMTAAEHIGLGLAGVYPDCRALRNHAVEESLTYLRKYRSPIPAKSVAKALAEYVHVFTLGISRPFGSAVFVTSWDKSNGGQIFLVDSSGLNYEYKAWAVGKHRQAAKAEIEKLKLDTFNLEQLAKEAARIIMSVRDEGREKDVTIEMSWVGEKTQGRAELVPNDFVDECEAYALQRLHEDDMDD